jgi:CBS domain-containing protein
MGDFRVRQIHDDYDRSNMYHHILDDIEAFEIMIRDKMFTGGPIHIGAEQELCLVDRQFEPATIALDFLDKINDDHYTNELALFNLEINCDPYPLKDRYFSKMQACLEELLKKGYALADGMDADILLAGILPTLKFRHLQFDFMTPERRYQTLSQELFKMRGHNFDIYLQGTDELIMSLDTVLFEACNTSFQTHLQIHPEEFVDKHNWAQMISGPVLSTVVNSPLVFGKELWHETRIALFKQSLDTRSSSKFLRQRLPRVYFGNRWIKESAADLWKNDVCRFPLILTSDDFKHSTSLLKEGHIPKLRAIRLHNGTTYTWNRLCFGHSDKEPHLRIECRYIPAGPTVTDEFANFAFWIGLMNNQEKYGRDFWKNTDFKVAKTNFIKAARTGFNTVFYWFGKNITAKQLILDELLEMAYDGLVDSGVHVDEAKKYLSVIEKRTQWELTGSEWILKAHRDLVPRFGEVTAQKTIVKQSLEYQKNNIPLHDWEPVKSNIYRIDIDEELVEEHMSTDIFCVSTYDSIELTRQILEWNNIRHLPVESDDGDLIGMITDGIVERVEQMNEDKVQFAGQVMIVNPVTIQSEATLAEARALMQDHDISGLPVVFGKKLVGIITNKDIHPRRKDIS